MLVPVEDVLVSFPYDAGCVDEDQNGVCDAGDVDTPNPTELAIAIQYDHETMDAPVVVAKGAGVVAQRIRRLALENNIPVVERKELARV